MPGVDPYPGFGRETGNVVSECQLSPRIFKKSCCALTIIAYHIKGT